MRTSQCLPMLECHKEPRCLPTMESDCVRCCRGHRQLWPITQKEARTHCLITTTYVKCSTGTKHQAHTHCPTIASVTHLIPCSRTLASEAAARCVHCGFNQNNHFPEARLLVMRTILPNLKHASECRWRTERNHLLSSYTLSPYTQSPYTHTRSLIPP